MLKYPNYSREQFRCIKSPLGAAKLLKKVKTIELRKTRYENSAKVLMKTLQGAEDFIKVSEQYVSRLRKHCEHEGRTPAQRKYELSCLLRDLLRSVQYPAAVGGHERLAFTLLGLYGAFDDNEFTNDLFQIANDQHPDTVKDVGELDRAQAEIQRAERDLKNAWEDGAEVFDSVPLVWHDDPTPLRTIPEAEHERIRARNVERILREFGKEWKLRAPLFSEPVTIVGIAIGSLPHKKRKEWEEAYNVLDLGDIPKRLYFTSIRYEMSEAEKWAAVEEEKEDRSLLARVFG